MDNLITWALIGVGFWLSLGLRLILRNRAALETSLLWQSRSLCQAASLFTPTMAETSLSIYR